MHTTLISIYIKNLNHFEDEQKIIDALSDNDKIEKVTVNVVDRNVIVSGHEIVEEEIRTTLHNIGFEVEK